ncbi:MAG: flagellar protein [Ignavibacteria bacterium]|nr:flagellar protein [Ignavibacteria bacterium]
MKTGVSQLTFDPIRSENNLRESTQLRRHKATISDFRQIFQQEIELVKLSAHAKARIQSREIEIEPQDFVKLNRALEEIENKGCRETLVIFEDKSLLISIPNRTIITAFSNHSNKEKIITNIDSVAFL